MSLNPSFHELFPRSMLLICIDDDMSCSLVCKCALLIGWWRRMEWPVAFLRRGSEALHKHEQAFSGAGDLVFDLAEVCPWRDQRFAALLSDFGTASVTLAGSGLHDVLLGAAIAANSSGIPTTVVNDAVEGRTLANLLPSQSNEMLLSLLEPFALLMPAMTFGSAIDLDV
jgi:hypothetical protein